jgi:hypothetical protein
LHEKIIKLPQGNEPLHDRIKLNSKFNPYFKDCLGALDGTHINMIVPTLHQQKYRNRKGYISQNVLGVCNFDMRFQYILAGWEGSAHDGLVIQDAVTAGGFDTPQGKYWLGLYSLYIILIIL